MAKEITMITLIKKALDFESFYIIDKSNKRASVSNFYFWIHSIL